MNIKSKADASNIGFYPIDFFNGNQKALSAFDFNRKQMRGQCVKCRSDYMKFSVNGFCQDC